MRVWIYCRISKDRIGAGMGVELQEKLCRERARKEGWTVDAVYTDNDLSAYNGKPRPGYEALLAALQANPADGEVAVLVWHTDRLHRSPPEMEGYIEICQPRKIPTHAVKAGSLDLTTAWGRKEARDRANAARYESEHMSERITERLLDRAMEGRAPGGPRPFGWEPGGEKLRPSETEWIATATRMIIAGSSLSSVRRHLDDNHVRPVKADSWSNQSLRAMLMRPRNAGLRAHHGEIVAKAVWPPVVSEAEWRACAAILADPTRRAAPSTSLRWQGSGCYLCGICDGDEPTTMRSNSVWQRKQQILVPAYRCRANTHNSILAEPVDDYVNTIMAAYLRRDDFADIGPDDGRGVLLAAQGELTALTERRKQLAAQHALGEMDELEWASMRQALKTRAAELEAQLSAVSRDHVLGDVARAADRGAAFLASAPERRRAILQAYFVVRIVPPASNGRRPAGQIDIDRVQVSPV